MHLKYQSKTIWQHNYTARAVRDVRDKVGIRLGNCTLCQTPKDRGHAISNFSASSDTDLYGTLE